jgi:tetratricopeptide (TPR) repeat protein
MVVGKRSCGPVSHGVRLRPLALPTLMALSALLVLPWHVAGALSTEPPEITARKLFQAGQRVAESTHYLEALDLFEEARDILEENGHSRTRVYSDLLYAIAQTKVKGRLHQNFAASYVKSALADIKASNRLRERLSGVIPQQLADGYYLEGFIHKRFFMRKLEAKGLFERAIRVFPGHVAAKRELSGLVIEEGTR